MSKDKEQLIETRKAIILSKLQGRTEAAKQRAFKSLHLMDFKDHAEFTEWVDETYGADSDPKSGVKQATDEEIDKVMQALMPGYTSYKDPLAKQEEESELDKIIKSIM